MAKALDMDKLSSGFTSLKIGRLKNMVISILNLNRPECYIILWEDRFKYIEKHIQDFKSEAEFKRHISQMPDIIENPDYVGIHPKSNSIEYIKRIDELMIIAVRLKEKGDLSIRSAYPLSEDQLENYLRCGTAVKISNNIDNIE